MILAFLKAVSKGLVCEPLKFGQFHSCKGGK
jgi:hypothetical protein